MDWIHETGYVLYCAIIIFLQAGFLLLENKSSTVAIRIFAHCAVVGIATFLLYGNQDFLKTYAFAITAAAIPGLAIGDPLTTRSYMFYSTIFGFFIYPLANFLVWNALPIQLKGLDIISPLNGMIDYAGSAGVHVLGGIFAIPLLFMFKKRVQELNHDPQLIALAGGIFFMGFLGFNCVSGTVSPLHIVATNTMLAAFGGTLGVMLFSRKPADIVNGLIAGLVASCAGVANLNSYIILLAAFIAGIAFYYVFIQLKDFDPIGVIGSHAVAGIIGTLFAAQTYVQIISIPLLLVIFIPLAFMTSYLMQRLDDTLIAKEIKNNTATLTIKTGDLDYIVASALKGKAMETLKDFHKMESKDFNLVLDLSEVKTYDNETFVDALQAIIEQCREYNGHVVAIGQNDYLKELTNNFPNVSLFTSSKEASGALKLSLS